MKIRIYDAGQRNANKSGYGLMAKQIGEGLLSLGHDVCYFPDDKTGEDVVLWIRPPHYLKYPEFDINKKNIIYTMHESETFTDWKSDWPALLNKATAVITPTEWNRGVFKNNGVTVPIHVVPLGVNPKDFKGCKHYQFSMMTLHDALGSSSSRENWKDTLRAYYKTFAGDRCKNAILTIKSYNIKYDKYLDFLTELQSEISGPHPIINIVDVSLLPESLNDLYRKHRLFIKNCNREGWSLPLLEAMSANLTIAHTRIPVLDWTDGYHKKHTFKVGDTDALSEIMEYEYRKWKKEKGFINKFAWKNCVKGVEDVLKT